MKFSITLRFIQQLTIDLHRDQYEFNSSLHTTLLHDPFQEFAVLLLSPVFQSALVLSGIPAKILYVFCIHLKRISLEPHLILRTFFC